MKKSVLMPWNLFLIIGLFVGIALSFFTPYGTGFDEVEHLARVYDISRFQLSPNSTVENKIVYFTEFNTLSQRRLFFRDQSFDLFKPEYFLVKGNYRGMTIKETPSIYPPIMFLPQALIAGIGWGFTNSPIIPLTILIRLVGLAVYLTLTYFAIRTIPIGRWGLLVIALLPTTLYQASTVNGDGFNYAVSFLFIAQVVRLIVKSEQKITNLELIALCITILLLSASKQGAIVIYPLLLLIPRRVFQSRFQYLICWLVILLSVFFHLYWNFIHIGLEGIGQQSQVASTGMLFNQLWESIQALFWSIYHYFDQLYIAMVAAYGYWIGEVPVLVFWIFPIIFLVSLLLDLKNEKLTPKKRIIFFVMMLVSWSVLLLIYTIGHINTERFTLVGDKIVVTLKQGRYLIPYLPLLVVSLTGLVSVRDTTRRLLSMVVFVGIVIIQALFLWGLYAHYYTSCGPYLFTGQNCELPAYQNIELDEPPEILLRETTHLEQDFTNTCRNLTEVQVLIGDNEIDANGNIRLSLVDPSGAVILSQTHHTADLTPLQLLSLPVPPGQQLQQGAFTIRIQPVDLTGKVGFAIRYPDRYPGEFREDGDPVDADLVFFYFCAPAGLFSY